MSRIELRDEAFAGGKYGQNDLIYGFNDGSDDLQPITQAKAYELTGSIILNPNDIERISKGNFNNGFSLQYEGAVQALGLKPGFMNRTSDSYGAYFTGPRGHQDIFKEAVRYATAGSATPLLILNNGNSSAQEITRKVDYELGGYITQDQTKLIHNAINSATSGQSLDLSAAMEFVNAKTNLKHHNRVTDFHKYTVEQARNKTLKEDFSANITQYSTGMVDQTMRNWSITFKDDKAPAYMKANALGGVVLDVVTLASLSSALRLGRLKLGKTQLIKQEIAAEDRIKLIGFKNKKLDLSISRPKVTQSNKTTTKQTSIKAPSITTVATKQKSKSSLSANQQKQIEVENVYVKKDKALITQSAANDSVSAQQVLAGGQKTVSVKNSGGIVSVRTQVNNTQPALPEGYFYRTVNNKVQVVRKDASSLPKLSITAGGKLYKPGNNTVVTIPKSKAGNNSGKAQQILAGGQKTGSMKNGGTILSSK